MVQSVDEAPMVKSAEREKKASKKKNREAGLRAGPMLAPTVGKLCRLCILIEFPDVPQSIARQEVIDFCNKTGIQETETMVRLRTIFSTIQRATHLYQCCDRVLHSVTESVPLYRSAIAIGTRARQLIVKHW
jgi:hypothetical protein